MLVKTLTHSDGIVRTSIMMDRSVYEGFNGLVAKTYPTENRDAFFVDIVGLGTTETTSLAAARAEALVEIRRLEALKDPKVSQANRLAFLRTISVL